jgi:formylglycine-generating enzyme required for sulfatase activity
MKKRVWGTAALLGLVLSLLLQGCSYGGPKPGTTFRDCKECPEVVVIPPGKFMMGEYPDQHQVTIKYSFAMGKYPVTRDQYAAFVAASGYNASGEWKIPGIPQTGTHPVVDVDWEDAQAYVKWLSQKTGKHYRLPSEAEYEYAERAGTITKYWWGDRDDENCAHADSSACTHAGGTLTMPVGSYPPNGFGLYDMAGNVWEWTEDCGNWDWNNLSSIPAGAPPDGKAWTTGKCDHRIVRGGSYVDDSDNMRSGYRGSEPVTYRHKTIGFRVALTL